MCLAQNFWKQKSAKLPMDTTPIGSGCRDDRDHFAIDWMSGDPAPTAVLEPEE